MARPVRSSAPLEEDELRKRGYYVGAVLGEGSYAKVKWALSEKLGRKVALKIISKKRAPLDFQQKFLPRELETMKLLNHPNIIKLYDIINIKDKLVMVMEMAGHGDLLEYVRLRGALNEEKARQMFAQLVSAVQYMHGFDVVHRDLKCENILLDVHNNVKLSDFGFARLQTTDQLSRTYCGSAAYASPEVLQGIPYHGTLYDIWSLGVILYIMVCGSMPYDDTDVKKMIKYQTERKVGFSRHKKISDDVKELIHGILEAKTERRFTIADICRSTWMNVVSPSNPGPRTSNAPGPLTVETATQVTSDIERRPPTASVNNEATTTTTRLPRPVPLPPPTGHGPRRATGGSAVPASRPTTACCGQQARSARRHDDSLTSTGPVLWSPGFDVRRDSRVRASGR